MRLHQVSIVALSCLLTTALVAQTPLAPRVVKPTLEDRPLGPLAKQAFELLRREVAALRKDLHPWKNDPRARLFTAGGHTEHHVRPQTQTMLAFATVVRFSPDARERKDTLADLVAMLRFVAPTHSAGPVLCSDGKKWQNQWQSALWAYQAGAAAWLVWDQLDDELRELIANMIAVEADRFIDKDPPNQVKNDTKAEENAWNSTPVALAFNMMPTHPHSKAWKETAVRWQLSSFLTQADTNGDKVIEGKPIKDYRLGANIHADFSLENHDRVHPSYMSTITINIDQALIYRWAKNEPPASLYHNAEPIYALLKRFAHPDGRMHFPNGQDWELHRLTLTLHAIMNVLFKDAEAACLERVTFQTVSQMQARTPDGPTCLKHEYFFPSYPGMVASDYAYAFLFHRQFGEGVEPVPMQRFLEQQSGVWKLDEGQFAIHRTPQGFVSFSWGSRVMGQAIPFTMDLLGSPYEVGFVGQVQSAAKPANAKAARAPSVKVRQVDVNTANGRLLVRAALLRAGAAVEQQVVFYSPGDGVVLYAEQLKALADVDLSDIRTGMIGVLNEPEWPYQGAPRRLAWKDGKRELDGRSAQPEFEIRSPWLNIDDTWTFAVIGADGFKYAPTSRVDRGRREQLVHLAPPAQRQYKAGQLIARRAMVVDMMKPATAAPRLVERLNARIEGEAISLTLGDHPITITFPAELPEFRAR